MKVFLSFINVIAIPYYFSNILISNILYLTDGHIYNKMRKKFKLHTERPQDQGCNFRSTTGGVMLKKPAWHFQKLCLKCL